jgi:hypothetical protein
MMYRLATLSLIAAIFCAGITPAFAGKYTGPGLSAKLVIRDPRLGSGRYGGTYYFDRGGYRIEIEGRARYKTFVFNSFYAYFITIGANRRMEVEDDKDGSLSAQFGDEPCAGFNNALNIGSDSAGGRELEVWRCDRPKQELLDSGVGRDHKTTVWYDPDLKHFIRKESNDGVKIELKDIVPGRQAPVLFDIPTQSGPVSATGRVADVETIEN